MPWEQGLFVLLRWSLSQIKQPQLPKNRDFPGAQVQDKILTVFWGVVFSMSSTRGQSSPLAERLLAFCGYHHLSWEGGDGKSIPSTKYHWSHFLSTVPVFLSQIDDFQFALWLWLVSQVLKGWCSLFCLYFHCVFCGRVCSLRSSCHSGSWSPGKLIPKHGPFSHILHLSAESLFRACPASIRLRVSCDLNSFWCGLFQLSLRCAVLFKMELPEVTVWVEAHWIETASWPGISYLHELFHHRRCW